MTLRLFSAQLALQLLSTIARADETCSLALDIVLLQDTTASFDDDLGSIANGIPQLFEGLATLNPNSKVALAEFRDKPFPQMGQTDDFCRRFKADFTDDPDVIVREYKQMIATGGIDVPEAIFGAIIETVVDPDLSWRPVSNEPDPDGATVGARVIILSTDAYPHYPGDWRWYSSFDVPDLSTPYPDDPRPYDRDLLCTAYDYPSVDQTAAWLEREEVILAILTPTVVDGLDEISKEQIEKVNTIWHDLNTNTFHNPAGMYQYINSNSSDAIEAILKILKDLTRFKCSTTTTTKNAPTTTTKTTSPETTTRHYTDPTSSGSDDLTSSPESDDSTSSDCINPTGGPVNPPNCIPNCLPPCGLLSGAGVSSGNPDETMELKIRKQPKLLDIHYEGWDSSEAVYMMRDSSIEMEEDVTVSESG